MEKKIIAVYSGMKGMLDYKYTLYENGEVVHIFDGNIYPGNRDIKWVVKAGDLKLNIKEKLLERASEENKEIAKSLLGI